MFRVVWKEGCSSDARKDPHLLGQACATMVYCLGQQLSRMEDTRAESLVGGWRGGGGGEWGVVITGLKDSSLLVVSLLLC